MRFFFVLVVMSLSAPVFAGEVRVSSIKAEKGDDFCQKLVPHVPEKGVNYRTDLENVVPADTEGWIKRPVAEPIRIPVEIELLDRLDLGNIENIPGIDLEPEVAAVEVYQDGRVLYNGQDISQQVKRKCGAPVPEELDITPDVIGSSSDNIVVPSKKPAPPKQKPVDPNAIEVEILEGQFP